MGDHYFDPDEYYDPLALAAEAAGAGILQARQELAARFQAAEAARDAEAKQLEQAVVSDVADAARQELVERYGAAFADRVAEKIQENGGLLGNDDSLLLDQAYLRARLEDAAELVRADLRREAPANFAERLKSVPPSYGSSSSDRFAEWEKRRGAVEEVEREQRKRWQQQLQERVNDGSAAPWGRAARGSLDKS